MPSSHAPIKKYNYERSLFRWVMSRHPEPFEKHGITTRTLERAPLAREAFYTSDWPGARALVQSNAESKYERTPFFDAIIERGLRTGTRFSIDHVTSEEKTKLGITVDRATGKFYLAAYGSPKARRGPSRRGSQTSTDGEAPDPPHAVMKEVEEALSSELEAAGEHAEVQLEKHVGPGATRGSKILRFTVSIRRRNSSSASCDSVREREDSGSAGQADESGSNKVSVGAFSGTTLRRRDSSASTGSGGARQAVDGSPRQATTRDMDSALPIQGKPRGRSAPAAGDLSNRFEHQDQTKRRRSTAATVFGPGARIGSGAGEQDGHKFGAMERDTVRRAGRSGDLKEQEGQSTGGRMMGHAQQAHQYATSSGAMSTTARGQGLSSGFPAWGGTFQPRSSIGGGNGHSHAHISSQGGGTASSGGAMGNGGASAMGLSSTPPPPWNVHSPSRIKTEDQHPGTSRSASRTSENGGSEGSTPSGLGSMPQYHVPGVGSFVHRQGPTSFGRASPAALHGAEPHGSMAGLNTFPSHVVHSHMGANGHHGSSLNPWAGSARISGALPVGREQLDEEDMDFLASFF